MTQLHTTDRTINGRRCLVAGLSVLTALVIFGLGFGFGNRNLMLRRGVIPTLVDTQISQPKNVDLSLFWDVYQRVQDHYVFSDIKPQDQLYGAIKGMVASLDDPYSLFLTPQEQKNFFTTLNGKLEGIGAEVGQDKNAIIVIAPLDGSPAQKAGLKPGDEIVAVGGKDVSQLETLEAVVAAIRGPKGTIIKLTVIPKGETATKDIDITRDTITVPSVVSSIRDDGFGTIRISQFGETTGADARKAAQGLADKQVPGVVLDLRSNPGGFLGEAVSVSSIWIKSGPIVFEQYRDGHKDTFNAAGNPILTGVPLAVLVDGGSASASEIVSGAIQDVGVGRLFGVKTFGKGSVQDVTELSDDSALRLTIAKWLTPKGRSINHEGITPDEVVETPEDSGTTKIDPVLDRALAWLKTQIK